MILAGNILVLSIMAMGGLGILFSVFLAFADRRFSVKEDPRIESVMEILPNTNCGACGTPGCHSFAEKLLKEEMPVNGCLPGGQEVADLLSDFLGVASEKAKRALAVVLCKGGKNEALNFADYYGEKTCEAAKLAGGGGKACVYGCLGYADCVKACTFDAMAMDDNALPVIFYDKCVGCGDCVKACPLDLIELHPEDHKLFVYCKNKDKGAVARKICKVSCIVCNLCVKDSPVEGGIEIADNLAVINFDKLAAGDEPIKRCPTRCILNDIEKDVTRENFYKNLMREAV